MVLFSVVVSWSYFFWALFRISILRSSSNSLSANQSFLAVISTSVDSLAASTTKVSNSSKVFGVGEFLEVKCVLTVAS